MTVDSLYPTRPPAGADKVRALMRILGKAARSAGRIYYDFYAQALAKIERGHRQDVSDVRGMGKLGLICGSRLIELFESIEPSLVRYPAIDPHSFRSSVLRAAREIVS